MQTALQTQEKRKFPRVPSNRAIVLIIDNKSYYGTLTDLSKVGLGFIADLSLNVSQTVELHFDLREDADHEPKSFQFKATIAHCINLRESYSTQDGFHIGVKLDLPTKKYTEIVEELFLH